MHLEKKHWVWIGVAVAGVAGLYLLSHRGGGATAGGADLPQTGPPQTGNMTPSAAPSSSMDMGQDVAQQLSSRALYMQQALAGHSDQLSGSGFNGGGFTYAGGGAVSKAWQQIEGGWEDRFHPGHVISEGEAQSIASSNHGPYAKGGGGFFGQLGGWVSNNLKQAAQIYLTAETGVAVSQINQFAQSQMPHGTQQSFYSPYAAPQTAPTRPPAYGNPPAYNRSF